MTMAIAILFVVAALVNLAAAIYITRGLRELEAMKQQHRDHEKRTH